MKIRFVFDEDAANYDKIRPSYPDELFIDIFTYFKSHHPSYAKILEIGMGTGQATLPFLTSGFNVTAIELGKHLSDFVGNKFKSYSNLTVINGDFMDVSLVKNSFDLIYSATAFHWLPNPEKYQRVKSLLKPNGMLALFWNHPFVRNKKDPSNMASAAVYDKYRPTDQIQNEFDTKDMDVIKQELKINGFKVIESKLYKRIRTLDTESYISLLNTYSDHRILPKTVKENFENVMREAINKIGGKINIYDTIDLYLAVNNIR